MHRICRTASDTKTQVKIIFVITLAKTFCNFETYYKVMTMGCVLIASSQFVENMPNAGPRLATRN